MSETLTPKKAAFFDVDRTLLAGASGLHLAWPLRKRGLINAKQLVRTMLVQLAFATSGSNSDQLDRFTETARKMMQGWPRAEVVDVVHSELETRIKPMVFLEALERIEQHKSQGLSVYAVSATFEEIITPLARMLGMDGAIATRMEVVDDHFTGEILEANHGPEKAQRLKEFADANGYDLESSVAYSDSITDAEFLRSVGRAYAVNPDKELRALAKKEGWGILRFTTRVRAPIYKRRAARAGMLALATGVLFSVARSRRRRSLR